MKSRTSTLLQSSTGYGLRITVLPSSVGSITRLNCAACKRPYPLTNARFLHQNQISKIENLSHLSRLHTLNLASNQLTSLSGLEGLSNLQTLDVSHNKIADINDCVAIKQCPLLKSFDVRDNQMADGDAFQPFFADMPNIQLLYLRGNPGCRKVANYRKVLITTIPSLVYFDERTITETDRMLAEAFVRGGKEEEIRVRDEYAEAQRQKDKKASEEGKKAAELGAEKRKAAFKVMMEKVKAEKAELLQKRDELQSEVDKLEDRSLFRPYKLNEIAEIEREMKAFTFERILENNEECPEGLIPAGATDSKSYMRKYIDAKRQDDLYRSSKPPR